MPVSLKDLQNLPRWALLAFAARCARRVVPLYKPTGREALPANKVRYALEIAERAATEGAVQSGVYLHAGTVQAYDAFALETYDAFDENDPASCARAAVNGAIDAHMSIATSQSLNLLDPVSGAADAAAQASRALNNNHEKLVADGIRRDLELLKQAAAENSWDDSIPVPPNFFPHYSIFDLDIPHEGMTIIDVGTAINQRLLDYFRRHPTRLHELSPRQFEELIAQLFDEFGFDVELTKQTRDGGKDIVAIKHNTTRDKYLIECKRYANETRVGIEIVQRMYGVVHLEHAFRGIIVTTSTFTRPANEIIKSNWALKGVDFDGLTRWLSHYQTAQMRRTLGF
jgi:hypothetical protein